MKVSLLQAQVKLPVQVNIWFVVVVALKENGGCNLRIYKVFWMDRINNPGNGFNFLRKFIKERVFGMK